MRGYLPVVGMAAAFRTGGDSGGTPTEAAAGQGRAALARARQIAAAPEQEELRYPPRGPRPRT